LINYFLNYCSLQVIFSDEKKFNLDGPDGFNGYWHDLRKEKLYFSKRNFGGGSLMVWGGFTSFGTLELAFPSTKMNSEEYIAILGEKLVPFLKRYRRIKWTFQHDNASVHSSKATKAWLQQRKIDVIAWPSCSPDCNPIENLWGILVRHVYAENRQYNSVAELKASIINAWNNIDVQTLTNLVCSMPNRVFSLINKNGGPFSY
jgi:transposase